MHNVVNLSRFLELFSKSLAVTKLGNIFLDGGKTNRVWCCYQPTEERRRAMKIHPLDLIVEFLIAAAILGMPLYASWIYYAITGKFLQF